MSRMKLTAAVWLITTLGIAAAQAQVIIPGADGSDGPFNPTSNIEVRLDWAPNGTWDGPNPNPGEGLGVYDPEKWAIVFRYSEVNIPSGVTVSFFNHPANPPVVWLVDGPVTINGTVNLSASGIDATGFYLGGPGGFRGAGVQVGVGGLGIGGGTVNAGGQYGSGERQYGNDRVIPLIGGSGGGYKLSGPSGSGPGPGMGSGGAILIASTGTISINGIVLANGGTGFSTSGGAGGGLRLVCHRLQGGGQLRAVGGIPNFGPWGGPGRIRIEANEVTFADVGDPTASFGLPGEIAQIWPDDAIAPAVRLVSLGSEAVPLDPRADFAFPNADVNVTSGAALILVIECRNIPTGFDPPDTEAWNVKARVVPRGGGAQFTVDATYVSGNYDLSIWEAEITLPNGFSGIQVRASMPPQ